MFCVTQGDSVLLLDRVCLLPCLLLFPARYQVADTHASSCDPLRKPGTDSQHGGIFQIQQRRQIRRWSKDTEASLTPRLPPPTPLYHWHAWVCGVYVWPIACVWTAGICLCLHPQSCGLKEVKTAKGALSKAFLSPSLRFSFHLLPVHVSLQSVRQIV